MYFLLRTLLVVTLCLSFSLGAFAQDLKSEYFKELLTHKYLSASDVEMELKELNKYFLEQKMQQAYFNAVYIIVTGGIKARIDRGDFENPKCIEKMILSFSEMYRDALYDYYFNNALKTPISWQKTFEANELGFEKPTVQLLLGMNAHIIHDLPESVDKVARNNPTCSLENVHDDYFKLNKFFNESINILNENLQNTRRALESDNNKLILRPIKAGMVKVMVSQMRSLAWDFATLLNGSQNDYEFQDTLTAIEIESKINAEGILAMKFLIPANGL